MDHNKIDSMPLLCLRVLPGLLVQVVNCCVVFKCAHVRAHTHTHTYTQTCGHHFIFAYVHEIFSVASDISYLVWHILICMDAHMHVCNLLTGWMILKG